MVILTPIVFIVSCAIKVQSKKPVLTPTQIERKLYDHLCQISYSNTTVYYGIHKRSKCIPVDSGVTNLIHDRRSCVDFTLKVRRMWLDVSTQV